MTASIPVNSNLPRIHFARPKDVLGGTGILGADGR
jgi:hypothetical protein